MKKSISSLMLFAAVVLPAVAATPSESSKSTAKASHATAKKAAPAPAEAAAPAPVVLSPEQLAIADKVQVGKFPCELGATVTLAADAQSPGRFLLETGHRHFVLTPAVSATGAVRLEDAVSGALWLQLGNKSMLMDQKEGKRLADDCMSPEQQKVAQAMAQNPAPGLLDTPMDASAPVAAAAASTPLEVAKKPAKAKAKPKAT